MAMNVEPTPTNPVQRKRTIRFRGLVGKQELLILLDSGSSRTFISEALAQKYKSQLAPCQELQLTTADGAPMISNQYIPEFQWFIQGHSFSYDTRVLPLKCYDMIMGADWLEYHSPTWVRWRKKKLKFPLNGKRVMIQGVKDDLTRCKSASPHKLKGLLKRSAISHCVELKEVPSPAETIHTMNPTEAESEAFGAIPSPVKQVVYKYKHLFQEPSVLPPAREDDHHIPLISGSQPVNIRPYKYSPQQKTEIEKQIEEMLSRGVIQHSVSPYASLVLLVKKKDGTWRFFVDYRHLNAITVENKHPLPIVDEL
jgi:hypothetical protein